MNTPPSLLKWLLALALSLLLPMPRSALAQNTPSDAYALPDRFQFDYKVVQQTNSEEGPKIRTLLFTKNGDYMAILPDADEANLDLTIQTKDGHLITFGQQQRYRGSSRAPITYRNIIEVRDMRAIMSRAGVGLSLLAKLLPKSKKTNDSDGNDEGTGGMFDNFQKTGRTKQVFGYLADEYTKTMTGHGKREGSVATFSAWFAHVDFDPSLLFGMGMGSLASPAAVQSVQTSHPNNLFGLAMTQKNYLPVEMSISQNGGPSQVWQQVTSIEKITLSKAINGYSVRNYTGMSLQEIMQRQSQDAKANE